MFVTQTLVPPWPRLDRNTGASVTDSLAIPDGSLVAIAGAGVAGSVHNYAGVYASFDIPADCKTLRAVAPVSVNWYAWVWAWPGYASAECVVTPLPFL
jgi:hypothetical protein